jgi:hypothetical protein
LSAPYSRSRYAAFAVPKSIQKLCS